MIIDAHQHFIDYSPAEYPWIGEGMEVLKRSFLSQELRAAARPAGVELSVAVEARQSLAETQWLLEIAGSNPLIGGVVGWADLCDPGLDAVLERLCADAHLKGLRHVLHDETDDKFMLRPDFRRGIGRLARFGLAYDILIFPRHLPQTLELVRGFPDQPFVIDHIAKPRIRDGELASWRAGLRPLAACSNLSCKLSGMVTEAKSHAWKRADFRPYIETVIELFGPERLMFGSDWPVCTLEASYAEVLAIVDEATAALSADERKAILGGTAAAFYGLEPRSDAG